MVTRLNVISGNADSEMNALRAIIHPFEDVSGLDELITTLQRWCHRNRRVEILDAVGHSNSDGFLAIGTWLIDDSPQTAATFSELLRPWLMQLSVRTIRLLGCSTACTERGRKAMRRVAWASGCNVVGTKRFISRNDYATSGFVSGDALVNADGSAVQC